jgi:hypothetical protein
MKNLQATAVALTYLLPGGAAMAQNANMMNGGAWHAGWMGAYGGTSMPILLILVVIVAALVAWIVARGRK